jgi:hypothetical protein
MNAYELADTLNECIDDGSTDLYCVCHAAKMLRQQADRIAHLEMLLANRNEIIDKLDLTTSQIKKHCEPLCKPSLCDCFKKANEK